MRVQNLQSLGGNYLGILCGWLRRTMGDSQTYRTYILYVYMYVDCDACTHTFVLVRTLKGRASLKRDPSFRKPCGMHIFRGFTSLPKP